MTETKVSLLPGAKLPPFKGEDWQGNPVNSSDYAGHKLWFALYRYASCPLCNLRIHEIMQRWPEFAAKGLNKVAVFQSDGETMARYVAGQDVPFTLIADPDEKLYRQFGSGHSWPGYLHPANLITLGKAACKGFGLGQMDGTKSRLPMDILVNADGTIHTIYRAKKIGDHIPFGMIDAFLA